MNRRLFVTMAAASWMAASAGGEYSLRIEKSWVMSAPFAGDAGVAPRWRASGSRPPGGTATKPQVAVLAADA